MGEGTRGLQAVYSQVADVVNTMYQRYRKKYGLKDESDTETQLEILESKGYISHTFISALVVMADNYAKGMKDLYEAELKNYKNKIQKQIELV